MVRIRRKSGNHSPLRGKEEEMRAIKETKWLFVFLKG